MHAFTIFVLLNSFLLFEAVIINTNAGKRYAASIFHQHDCSRPQIAQDKTITPDAESYHLYEPVKIASEYGGENQHSLHTYLKCVLGNSWELAPSTELKRCEAPNIELEDMDQLDDPEGFYYSQGSIIRFLYKMANNRALELYSICDNGKWKMDIPEFD